MRRRRPRSEHRTIGSRVYPLRSPPPAPPSSMPSVGARRSTSLFVPKPAASKPRVRKPLRTSLPQSRSGADADDNEDWIPLAWWRAEEGKKRTHGVGVSGWNKPAAVSPEPAPIRVYSRKHQKLVYNSTSAKFRGFVYSRKRRRSQVPVDPSDGKFKGIVYARRPRKKLKLDPVVEEDREHGDVATEVSVRNFAAEVVGESVAGICSGSEDTLALTVCVEPFHRQFVDIFISVATWMRRRRAGLSSLGTILFSESLAGVLALHGIRFLPLQPLNKDDISRNAISDFGLCVFHNAGQSVPLFSVDFATLPNYFKDLHVGLAVRSFSLSGVLIKYLMDSSRFEEDRYALVPVESVDVFSSLTSVRVSNEVAPTLTPAAISIAVTYSSPTGVRNIESQYVAEVPELDVQNMAIGHSSTFQKHLKKKRKMRSRADRKVIVSLQASCPSVQNLMVPICVRPVDVCFGDMVREDDDTTSPCGTLKCRRFDGTKEMRTALAEMKQNIDSVRCNVNVLVTASDRCWREEGAELMLEFSDSREWCIAVKVDDTIRYLHKPQEWRPCAVNRLNQYYMWGWEDGWKLEFYDKWDWAVFKELHAECRERNALSVPVKIIPVPGVQVVSDYEDIVSSSFKRPDKYIHMLSDEVERAVASEHASYDMDSGDEEWLRQLSSSFLELENNGPIQISEDVFEKIIFAFEKETYNNPHDIPDKETAVELCQHLGGRDVVACLYDYWLKKRNKRRSSLVKVFQEPPSTSTQFLQKPHLRKKRSLTRQRSQARRGKPDFYLQAGAEQEAKRRVQEADIAAKQATETAIRQRGRAQKLMERAQLAAYKSVMALRIAEAKRLSETTDLASVILD